jgi:dihydrofolate reductase
MIAPARNNGRQNGGELVSELFLQISVSLDGYIEDRDRDIEWMTSDTSFDAFITTTLIDEVRLIQYPLILGGGTPLFDADGKRRNLRLTTSERFESGATINRYRFA